MARCRCHICWVYRNTDWNFVTIRSSNRWRHSDLPKDKFSICIKKTKGKIKTLPDLTKFFKTCPFSRVNSTIDPNSSFYRSQIIADSQQIHFSTFVWGPNLKSLSFIWIFCCQAFHEIVNNSVPMIFVPTHASISTHIWKISIDIKTFAPFELKILVPLRLKGMKVYTVSTVRNVISGSTFSGILSPQKD